MYIPAAFRQTDRSKLFDFIEANSFGLLVSTLVGQLCATPLPLLVRREGSTHGQLLGHLARANPACRELAGQEVLAVFSGPHAYISPSWYESDNVVPTWNYVAVHAYGTCRVIDDEVETARIVEAYVTTYEQSMSVPWTIDVASPFFEKLVKMVVGFRIDITRLEGKWKLGQNHPVDWREKVARKLSERGDFNSQAMARLMRETLDGRAE